MKNIVFVIADLGMGGAQRVISLLANSLADNNAYHIDVVVMSSKDSGGFFSFPPQVSIHYADAMEASRGMVSALATNINRIRAIRRLIKSLKTDLVITFQTETNCSVLLSTFGMGVPVIISERSDPYIHPESRIWRFVRHLVYPFASGAVFQTAYAAGFFGNTIRKRVVIFNPVSIDDDGEGPVIGGLYILGVGRLSAEKGFDDLIRAHALARQNITGLKLVLVGSGPEIDKLVSLTKDLGTQDDVIFTGAQSRLGGYYKNAVAFVLPSRFEGLPNALIEAMAYGCPVIVTPLYKAAPEIIDHGRNGLIAGSATPLEFSNQVIDLYNNLPKRQLLALQGQSDSERFREDKVAAAWHSFITLFLK